MNPDTGHLMRAPEDEAERKRFYERFIGYVEVPERLNHAANQKLAGRTEALVSLTSGGALSRFAADQRKQKRKAKKASRRANRG